MAFLEGDALCPTEMLFEVLISWLLLIQLAIRGYKLIQPRHLYCIKNVTNHASAFCLFVDIVLRRRTRF